MKRVLAICGSTRQNSANFHILKAIEGLMPANVHMEIYTGIDKLPHFNPDLDKDDVPFEIKELRSKIGRASGIIICTPEYVFSLPGSLKNALEWMVSSSSFSKKPTALITASGMGEKAHESLELVMRTLEAEFNSQTRLLLNGARGKINHDGTIKDEVTVHSLNNLAENFLKLLK